MAAKNRSVAKTVAFCSILTALSSVIMFLGGLLGILDMSSSMLASFCVIFAIAEFGLPHGLAVFAASSILTAILGAYFPVIYFTGFFGLYPIVKTLIERIRKIKSEWLIKLVWFTASAVLFTLASGYLFSESVKERFSFAPYVIFAILLICFVLYDIILTRLITIYNQKLRKRLFSFLKK